MAKKMIVYFLILLLTAYPVSAGEVSLTRWVLDITLDENGIVEVIMKAELQNPGPLALDGFSFEVPVALMIDTEKSSGTTISDNGEMKFNTPDVKQQAVSGGTSIIVSFDKPVEAGKNWSGRIGYRSEKIATKDDSGYSISVPVNAPQAIVSGKNVKTTVPADTDIEAQVFLPKSYEIISVEPAPFKQIFQYGRMVPTWTAKYLHIGDTIRIKTSYSDVLAKIVKNDDRARKLKADIKEAKNAGKKVEDTENYLAAANENNNKAFASFGGKDYSTASQYSGFASDELTKAENSLSGASANKSSEVTSKKTPEVSGKTPGFEAYILGFALIIAFILKRNV